MTKPHQKAPLCPNCGKTLKHDDNFCPNCGQANHDLRIPVKHLFMEALEGIIHFDSKSFRTIGLLLFKPGCLTNEFKAGKRMSYVPPIRLYIFLSFIFFLSLSLLSGKHHTGAVTRSTEADTTQTTLNISFYNINSAELRGLNDSQIDSLMQVRGIKQTGLNVYMARQVARLNGERRSEFNHRLFSGISYMMFVLMPIFAWLLYLLFRKRAEYYIDCLVFSVHYHAFAFLLFTFYLILGRLFDTELLILILPVIMGLYCYLGLRMVFRESWWRTVVKTFLAGILHSLAILACFLLMILVNIVLF
jgi:hypothetical protein